MNQVRFVRLWVSLTSDFDLHDSLVPNSDEVEVRVHRRELDSKLLQRAEEIILQLGRIGVDANHQSRRAK